MHMKDDELRQKISEEISKTEKFVEEYRDMTRPVAPDVSIGRISRMDAINNKSVAEAALREAEQKLNQLKQALEKVGSTEFGVCRRCKNPIPIGRILARPQSVYCVHCAR
jgi:DnaK suppressor protein